MAVQVGWLRQQHIRAAPGCQTDTTESSTSHTRASLSAKIVIERPRNRGFIDVLSLSSYNPP